MRQFESFKPYLIEALKLVEIHAQPICAEYGPGESTKTILLNSKKALVFSVEHDKQWFLKYKSLDPIRAKVFHSELGKDYFASPFDAAIPLIPNLVFVDGRRRVDSMTYAVKHSSQDAVLLLHDAHRPKYRPVLNLVKWHIWAGVPGDRTLILCKTEEYFTLLKSLQKHTPKLA